MLSSLALMIQPKEERAGCLALAMFFSFVFAGLACLSLTTT